MQISSANGDKITLYSSFEAPVNDDVFLIAAPMLRSEVYPIGNGERVKIIYFDASASFESDAVVGERVRKDGLNYIQMICASGVIRKQRRSDFRISVLLDAEVLLCDPNNALAPVPGAVPKKGIINDVSAGGAAMYIDEDIPKGSIVLTTLPADVYGHPKEMLSEVQWVRLPDSPDAPMKFYMGVRFIFESDKDKEALVRYTIEQQRKRMGKEGR